MSKQVIDSIDSVLKRTQNLVEQLEILKKDAERTLVNYKISKDVGEASDGKAEKQSKTVSDGEYETNCDFTVGVRVTDILSHASKTYRTLLEAHENTGISLYSLSVLSRSGNLWHNRYKISRIEGQDNGSKSPTIKAIMVKSDRGEVIVSDEMSTVAKTLGVEYSTLSRAIKQGVLDNTNLGTVKLKRLSSEELNDFKNGNVAGYEPYGEDNEEFSLGDYDL